MRDAIVIAGKLTIKVLSRWTRYAVAEVLEAGALYFDAVNDRTRRPVTPVDFDNEITPALRCKHNARLNQRCLKCDPERRP